MAKYTINLPVLNSLEIEHFLMKQAAVLLKSKCRIMDGLYGQDWEGIICELHPCLRFVNIHWHISISFWLWHVPNSASLHHCLASLLRDIFSASTPGPYGKRCWSTDPIRENTTTLKDLCTSTSDYNIIIDGPSLLQRVILMMHIWITRQLLMDMSEYDWPQLYQWWES